MVVVGGVDDGNRSVKNYRDDFYNPFSPANARLECWTRRRSFFWRCEGGYFGHNGTNENVESSRNGREVLVSSAFYLRSSGGPSKVLFVGVRRRDLVPHPIDEPASGTVLRKLLRELCISCGREGCKDTFMLIFSFRCSRFRARISCCPLLHVPYITYSTFDTCISCSSFYPFLSS
jgi:hypothetical protein